MALKEVDVIVQKTGLSGLGKKTQSIDSALKQQFIFNSIADVLSLNTPVFIKNYGPGSLATTAFRGGNASQTGVIWNGFNIQNAMLGQTDLALLPSVLFDDISIEYGGSSSLWGSGAVGGNVHLSNKPLFNKGVTTKANIGSGSFGLFNASAAIEQSGKRFISSTKAYLQNSTNNFRYIDTLDKTDPIKEQKHATYTFRGILQEFKFIINPKQMLSVNAWYNEGWRELPVYNTLNVSKAIQHDGNFKTSANWNYLTGKFNTIAKAAFFNDRLNYKDSAFDIDSKSRLNTFIIENENIYTRNSNHLLNFGINHTFNSATTDNYDGTKILYKTSVSLGNKFTVMDKRLIIFAVVRGEHISSGQIPVTGNVALEYKVSKKITAKLNSAKVYRQPTLNERYWNPGGNPDLLPEQGYTYEGDLSYNNLFGNFSVNVSGAAFYRIIDNWILWLPGINATTPVNIQQVFSRGTETCWKLSYRKNKFYTCLNVVTGYILSTVQNSDQENGNTLDKQLIYTPRYTVNSNLTLAYNHVSISGYHQYIGYRFTSSDNLQWLLPYHYTSIRLTYKTKLTGATNLILYAACNNLLNTNYSIIAGRYMPLRNFEIGISLSNNKPKTEKETLTK